MLRSGLLAVGAALITACAVPAAPPVELEPASTAAKAQPPRIKTVSFCGMAVPQNATEVFCEREDVADLAPLARLPKLEKLTLRFTAVTDLTPLASLPSLRELAIQGPSTDEECTRLGCGLGYFGPADDAVGFVPPPLDTPLSDLRPLSSAASLEVLRLGGTRVKDLSPLAGLAKLRVLDLRRTKVEKIPAGALPKSLESLALRSTPLDDAPGLAELVALEELDLWGTKLRAMPPLSAATKLRTLRYWSLYPALEEIGATAPMTELEVLEIGNARQLDLAPLRGKKKLRSVRLFDTGLKSLEPLAGLDGIQELYLDGWDDGAAGGKKPFLAPVAALPRLVKLQALGRVGDFAPLGKLTSLEELEIGGGLKRWITIDLAPLRGLAGLRRLHVRDASLKSHDALRSLTSLEDVRLTDTRAVPLGALGTLSKLQHLDYEVWGKADIQSFGNLGRLESLHLTAKKVESVAPLAGLGLRELQLALEEPVDITPLGEVASLEALILGPVAVDTLDPVAPLAKLTRLSVESNRLRSLEPIRGLERLERLTVRRAPVASLEPLAKLERLQVVELHGLPVTDARPLSELPALHTLFLSSTSMSREDEIAARRRVGGCWSETCGNWRAQRASYRATFKTGE